ncbi:DUF6319 family protein [Rhodococcoides kyotonense]|uniref:Translation initiation factor n=1 Tax=Rhodococcoides kyotonense TaxID=398843 RepID=A0A239N5S2_9NOCA|nr:DUF6319 family protein [Rhodococcus kyotonensis]SNT49528.1 hypothetical protein SAMN05421642_1293 [Rhodococcus kyotonensis]
MPPRRRSTANESLTPENLATLADALASGKRATVYLIEATPSLGLPEGTSARVVSIDGSTVTISPKGVNDELPFEADELRITRNPPGGAAKPAPKPVAPKPEIAEWTEPAPKPKPVTPKPVTPKPVTPKPAPAPSPATVSKPAAPAARKGKKGPDSVSVTIHAGADNDWSVTVTHGARRPGKAQPVTPESVSRAVRELGDDSAVQAVEAVISHARDEAAQRVAELSRQLEEAQSMLAALESGTQ